MPVDPAVAPTDAPPPRLVWLMGLTNLAYGFAYAAILLTVPQMLRERGLDLPAINGIVSLALFTSLFAFVLAPLLDTLVSRRTWALGFLMTAAVGLFVLFNLPARSTMIGVLLPVLALCVSLFNTSMGGWLGASLPKSADKTIATWFNIGNGSGFGIGALVQFPLMHTLPAPFGALTIAGLVLLPLVLFTIMPPPDAGRSRIHESFGRLGGDIAQLVRQKAVLRILALFLLPCASFALTNTVGGLGSDFHTSPGVVDFANGIGTWAMAVAASLVMQQVLKRVSPLAGYVGTGVVGALFTMAIVMMPHVAIVYVLAALGENFAQSAAFTAQNNIIFASIPEGSPLSATQFGLLQQAASVPLTYMEYLDGLGYDLPGAFHGVMGTFFTDAGISLLACLAVAPLVRRWGHGHALEVARLKLEEAEMNARGV